ncbi:MAG TPA: hypothetical protein VH207_01490 [Chthoniobacterales bacterium]|nr:hypothetical protein [Chthoniobacterales bacterium]
MKPLLLAFLTIAALVSPNALAQGKIDLHAADTVRSVLERQVGKTVELRLKSGEKIAGKLEKVTDSMALLAQLTEADFYDAAVDLDSVAAIVWRARSN